MISLAVVLVLAFVPGPGPGVSSTLRSGGCMCTVDLNPAAMIDTSQVIDDRQQPHLPRFLHR